MSVNFEPRPVRAPKRGPGAAVIALAAIAAFVIVGVVKPWQAGSPAAPSATGAASAHPAPPATGAPANATTAPAAAAGERSSAPRPFVTPQPAVTVPPAGAGPVTPGSAGQPIAHPLRFADLAGLLPPRDAYGVSIVRQGGTLTGGIAYSPNHPDALIPIYTAAWLRAPEPVAGAILSAPPSGHPILALAVTAPALHPPDSVRFLRLSPGPLAEPLAVPGLEGGSTGTLVFLPPVEDGATDGWPPGTYQVEIVEAARVLRFTLIVPVT